MTPVALVLFIACVLVIFGIACILTYRDGYRRGEREMDEILTRLRAAREELERTCRR